ncbi:ATP-binding protein [Streptomyces sp. NBC_00433]
MPTRDTDLRAPTRTWRGEFAPYERCVPLARRHVEQAMTRWGCVPDDVAGAALVTGELAANAVRHAHVPGRPFTVAVTLGDGWYVIEVTDPLTTPPRTGTPEPDDERGRGLLLVESLSEAFGHRPRPDGGKTVWAVLAATVRPVCGERTYLPAHLVAAALGPGTRDAEAADVERQLRCALEAHTTGDHHAFVRELAGAATGAVWTRWIRGHLPTDVFVLADCPAVDGHEPCADFAGHPGAHSWQLAAAGHRHTLRAACAEDGTAAVPR